MTQSMQPLPIGCVGWIGLGNIGFPMVRRVLERGYRVRVWARRREAAEAAIAEGAHWADEPEQLARECELVVSILGDSDDVLGVHRRLLPHASHGAVFLEMTTAAPATALQLNKIAAPMQAVVLDCPVTGGVSGAQKGTLTHFVGGDKDALARCRPLLETLSERIVFCGDSGAGYRMKLVNQTMVAGILLGLADGTALARASGFDAGILSEALTGGTASSFLFNSYAQRMLECTGPVTFTLGMLRKDLRLARAEAVARGTTTRLLDCALDAAEAACLRFGERAGAQCLAAGDCGGPAPRPDLLTI